MVAVASFILKDWPDRFAEVDCTHQVNANRCRFGLIVAVRNMIRKLGVDILSPVVAAVGALTALFAASMGADLPVVSDPKGVAAKRFGVLGLGGLYSKRWTFYVDAEGILRFIDKKVRPETAGTDMRARLRELNFPKRPPAAKTEP